MGVGGYMEVIIKEICTAPIFHIEWKRRALYNSNSNTYTHSLAQTCTHMCTHAHTCACMHTHTHIHTHTHTHHHHHHHHTTFMDHRDKNGCGKD